MEGETEALGSSPSRTQPSIPMRLRCLHTCRTPRSPGTARKGLILHRLGAARCFAVPQFTWKMGYVSPGPAQHRTGEHLPSSSG